ncbi:MAG: hypothetical protein IKE77_09355 [Erysipelotrichaceae bacterium]|nr:hypothetical protein [Erysipelotrichaceae bacterium]
MKKFLVVLLSVLMVCTMAACGKPAPKPLADDTHAAWVAHGQYLLADGTPNGWNGKDTALYEASALKAIALEDVKNINEALYNTLSGKEIKYLYTIDLILGVNDAGWTTNALIDGKLYRVNGSNAFKVAQCSVDADGDNKVYAEDQWISDPKTAHAESLTPDTLFMPVWQEENDEYGFSWASNPACIGVPGLYTLVIAQYTSVSSATTPGYGIGLVLKEAKDGQGKELIVEFVPADHKFGVVGAFNNWGETPDVEMTAGENNTWTAEVELAAGTEFKVRADGAWDNNWGTADGGNLVAETAGTYVVTITFGDEVTVTATAK